MKTENGDPTREFTLDDALAAWDSMYRGLSEEEVERQVRGFAALVRGIAKHGSVSAADFAAELGISEASAKEVLSSLAPMGLELDGAGRIVGAALTVRTTPHRMRLGGRELYAWCALDTLFIPGLLDEAAMVESTCPESGDEIRLEVEPNGARSWWPTSAVLSVVLPGVAGGMERAGPASPT